MLVNGFALAIATVVGFYLIYMKLPGRVRKWLQKHALLTDCVACVLTYMLFGGTLVALFAAAFVGIITSLLLALLNNEVTAEAMTLLAGRIKDLQKKFVEYIAAQIQKSKENGTLTPA